MSVGIAAPAQRMLRYALSGLALLFVTLALIGGVRGYSPVPFWDMWVGYLPVLDHAASGDWSMWWQQHNEHRIVLSRLLFWADLRWFDGAGWFLIAVNYILVALGAALFCRILREQVNAHERDLGRHALAAFIVVLLFFWSQSENLTWGFQSQFILAQLLPLAALYVLSRATQGGSALFALACLLGVLSAGTMANGVLALPLMTVYAVLTRQGARRIGVLASLSALVLFAYFHAYSSPAGHGSLSQAWERPGRFVRYVMVYLGSPFHFALGEGGTGMTVAALAGLFFTVSAGRFAWRTLRHSQQMRQSALPLALLFFIVYIIGTASGTAMGRMQIGVAPAFRYTTPALMAWAALLTLYAPALFKLQGRRRGMQYGAMAVLTLLMLAFQLKALKSQDAEMFDRRVAALAIELRVKDLVEISHVFPTTDVIGLAEQSAANQRSVFGLFPYRGARARMDTVFAPAALPLCQGFLDTAVPVEGDGRFLRVSGWLYEPARKIVPQAVRILDAAGRQLGLALSGERRDDVAAAVASASLRSGYRGYLSSALHDQELTLRGEGPAGPVCQLQVKAPMKLPFSIAAEAPSAPHATVGSANIGEGNGWLGTDYAKSSFPGMRVYGSFISSDADRGVMTLRLKRGDRLFYRSGPSVRQQRIEIEGMGNFPLPQTQDWVLLEFSGETLPQQSFTAKFSDAGSDWGEWSAIALLSN